MVAFHITVRKNKEKQHINTFQKLELMNVRHFCRKEALKPQYSTHQAWPPKRSACQNEVFFGVIDGLQSKSRNDTGCFLVLMCDKVIEEHHMDALRRSKM